MTDWDADVAKAREQRIQRDREANLQSAVTLRALGECITEMARALEEDDGILGALAGEGIASHLADLPKHVRDVFVEYASDEAARAAKADRLYWESVA